MLPVSLILKFISEPPYFTGGFRNAHLDCGDAFFEKKDDDEDAQYTEETSRKYDIL
jgi:hypothetical protein